MNQKDLKSKKIFILSLLWIFCPLFNFGQGYEITNLEIIPQYPHPTDEVKITFTVVTYSGANYNYENHAVVGNEIDIEACFGITATSVFQTFIDTISLGILPEGNYHVDFDCYANYATMICSGSPDDTLSETLDFLVSATNSIEISGDNSFIIYPNPSESELRIKATFDFNELVIYSVKGQKTEYTNPCACSSMTLDISDLSAGVYIIRVSDTNQNVISRFIKL